MNPKIILTSFVAMTFVACGEGTSDSTSPFYDDAVSSLLFEADGPFDLEQSMTPPNLDEEYSKVYGFSAEEVVARRAEVVQHFKDKFGADVDAPENAGRLILQPFKVDESVGYQITEVNEVPLDSAMTVHDFGWLLYVIDPDGFDLGGQYAGRTAPPGVVASAGDYGIAGDEGVVRIAFHSTRPFAYTETGGIDFECHLMSDFLGEGLGNGLQEITVDEGNGNSRIRIRGLARFNP